WCNDKTYSLLQSVNLNLIWNISLYLLLNYDDMSVAIRKRSWEEHVTQWMGQPFNSDDCNTACHHGLVADSLQASMEKDATLNVDRKERCVSLPDCCHGSELRDIPGRPMGHISKEVDEDDSHEDDKQILTTQGPKTSDQHSIKGAGSLVKTLPIMESNQGSYDSWGMAGGADLVLVEEKGDRKVVDMVSKSLELCKDISLSEIKDASKMNACDSLNVKDIVPEKQLLNSAVIAQHRRKPDFPKDEHERNTCSAVQDEFLAIPCADRGLPLLKTDSGSCLLQPPSCPSGMSAENGLEKSGFSEHQNRSLPKVNSGDGMQCLHIKETLATHEPTDNQVRLRKRKGTAFTREMSTIIQAPVMVSGHPGERKQTELLMFKVTYLPSPPAAALVLAAQNSIATLRTPFCIPHLLLMQLFETKTVKQVQTVKSESQAQKSSSDFFQLVKTGVLYQDVKNTYICNKNKNGKGSSFFITFPFSENQRSHSLDRMGKGNHNSKLSETSLCCKSGSNSTSIGHTDAREKNFNFFFFKEMKLHNFYQSHTSSETFLTVEIVVLGKLSLFAKAFISQLVNLRSSRNGTEKRRRAKRGGSCVNFEDKVEVPWAIRAFGKSLRDD
ncbi:hypothetical protein DBR06_SOUSAS1210032, partial [Sousa chinensis]